MAVCRPMLPGAQSEPVLIRNARISNGTTDGLIKEGAHGDRLLIDGNPLEDFDVLTRPSETLHLIMKGGVIHKDCMPKQGRRSHV
ncbi:MULTISPECIES: hypothetical protein [Halocynthiibacter]|uniref:Amidohydrolase-related domain-containing protein n=1 Tax=Halocynthiibacter halioticoli TaxID=2986804 RepID=A0AAE3LPW4_9RHOB|nr:MULTISPECIES: hypothetical protein [Halocynthiibacter]MCV6822928.1 hypothetical protein [Halocynthiibacter halioticoli]MCW4055929.1 hypothetical protein [Halocynthiibacter sp. SDUM655004]